MSQIAGRTVLDCLRDDRLDEDERSRMLTQVGHLIRRIHRIGVVHGDLSTNNMIWHEKNGPSLIDLGLAQIRFELERFGLDLHVLYEVLGASHPEHEDAMNLILQGYLDEDEMEEERRLCYVGITRAKELLYLTRTFKRGFRGNFEPNEPSRFLSDIPDSLVTSYPYAHMTNARRTSWYPIADQNYPNIHLDNQDIDQKLTPDPIDNSPDLSVGDKVHHQVFGNGIVTGTKPSNNDLEVTVAFTDGNGVKRMLLSFAPMEKME